MATPSLQELLTSPPNEGTSFHQDASEKEQGILDAMNQHFGETGYTQPIAEGSTETAELTEREMMFLSRETFMRYIKAAKGDQAEAIRKLEYTLRWRRTVKIDDVEAMAADCAPEADTGKEILLGFTSQAQPVVYFFPARNRTPVERRRAIHAVFMVERAKDLMTDGQTQVMVLFNFAGKREGPPTSVSVARETLHILSSHYPENLALSYFMNLSWLVRTFVNLMWPFVDPVTKQKVRFCSPEELAKTGDVDTNVLLKECGGELDMPYDHETYWPAVVNECLQRRQAHLVAWRNLGPAQVGRSERDFKKSTMTSTFTDTQTVASAV